MTQFLLGTSATAKIMHVKYDIISQINVIDEGARDLSVEILTPDAPKQIQPAGLHFLVSSKFA